MFLSPVIANKVGQVYMAVYLSSMDIHCRTSIDELNTSYGQFPYSPITGRKHNYRALKIKEKPKHMSY